MRYPSQLVSKQDRKIVYTNEFTHQKIVDTENSGYIDHREPSLRLASTIMTSQSRNSMHMSLKPDIVLDFAT